MQTTGCHPVRWRPGALVRVLAVASTLASLGCGGDSGPTNPTTTGPTGTFKGTLVGDVGESGSGVVTLTLPSAATVSTAVSARLAAAPVTVTGTLALTGGSTVQLSGVYDASANPQLVLAGGGYGLTGNYTAANGVFSGSATFPDGKTGQWTVSANAATVSVFCGTYTSSQGEGGGTWNVVLDGNNHLSGVATGAGQLQGVFTPGSNAVSVTYTGGTATGTLDPGTGGGSGTYDAPGVGDGDAGNWAATTGGC
jgi:hypothetical protein